MRGSSPVVRACSGRADLKSKRALELAKYEVVETLRDGRPVTIRALDRMTGTGSSRGQQQHRVAVPSVLLAKRSFTEKEVAYFVNVDFVDHLALVVVLKEGGRPMIVGGARY